MIQSRVSLKKYSGHWHRDPRRALRVPRAPNGWDPTLPVLRKCNLPERDLPPLLWGSGFSLRIVCPFSVFHRESVSWFTQQKPFPLTFSWQFLSFFMRPYYIQSTLISLTDQESNTKKLKPISIWFLWNTFLWLVEQTWKQLLLDQNWKFLDKKQICRKVVGWICLAQ